MITDKEIEEAATKYEEQELFIPSPHEQDGFKESFTAGAKWARDKMLERESDRFVAGASWSMDELARSEKKIKELEATISQLLTDSNGEFRGMSAYQRLEARLEMTANAKDNLRIDYAAARATNEKYRKALENCNFYNEPKSASIAREALKEGEE